MGWLLLILISHAAGIVWADRGGAWPTSLGVAASAASLAVGSGLVLVVPLVVPLGRASGLRRGARMVAIPLLALSSAAWGHAGLARILDRAALDAERAEALDPTALQRIDARVTARRPTRFGDEVELAGVRARRGEGEVPERLLLNLAPGGRASRAQRLLFPGAEVRLAVRIRPLRPTRNPGSPDRAHAWARRGIAARARLPKDDWIVERLAGPGFLPQLVAGASALRQASSERLRRRLETLGEGQGLVRALALGDRRGLSPATQDDFLRLGLTHLLSVSGLHIGFVAWPTAWGVHRLRVRLRLARRPAAPSRPRTGAGTIGGFPTPLIAASAAAGCYAWISGAEVPAMRASLLFALFAASRSLGWRIAPGLALVSIALLLLVADPAALFDLGAQLSFGACAALVVGGIGGRQRNEPGAAAVARIATVARTARRAVVEGLRTSLVVSLGMLPWIELQGLPRALPAPVVNALAIPWTGFVVMPSAFAAALLALALPEGPDRSGEASAPLVPSALGARSAPVAGAPGSLATAALEGLLAPAAGFERATQRLAAALPADWMDDARAGRVPWWLGIGGVAFALRSARRGALAPAALIWTGLAGLGFAPWAEAGFGGAGPRVVFLDVGQADAALLQTPASSWLIDSGPGPEDGSGGTTLVRALRAEGVRRLDGLVLTHGDLDHRGGALRVLSAVEVEELWLPGLARPDPALERIAAFANIRGTRVRRVAAGDRNTDDPGLRIEVLWPPRVSAGQGPSPPISGRARNEQSIVLAAELAGLRALFMADVGGEVEASLRRTRPDALRSDLLKAGHHGSRRSSTSDFLAAVAPGIVIVSAPCDAARGLPSKEALLRLRASGAAIGWTGRDGAVLVAGRGAEAPAMRYWGAPRRCAPGFERAPSAAGLSATSVPATSGAARVGTTTRRDGDEG